MATIGFNHWNMPEECFETKLETKDNVERLGYIPLREQVKMYKEAGVLLKSTRSMMYDIPNSKMSDAEKISTVVKDCKDYADMSTLIRRSEASARAAAELQKFAAEEAAKKAALSVPANVTAEKSASE